MKKILLSVIVITLFIATGNICANQEIPDSPVGAKFKLMLETFDSDEFQPFIENNFASEFLNMFPIDDHLSFFQQVKEMHDGFILHKIEMADEFYLVAIVKSKKKKPGGELKLKSNKPLPIKLPGLVLIWLNRLMTSNIPAPIMTLSPSFSQIQKQSPVLTLLQKLTNF